VLVAFLKFLDPILHLGVNEWFMTSWEGNPRGGGRTSDVPPSRAYMVWDTMRAKEEYARDRLPSSHFTRTCAVSASPGIREYPVGGFVPVFPRLGVRATVYSGAVSRGRFRSFAACVTLPAVRSIASLTSSSSTEARKTGRGKEPSGGSVRWNGAAAAEGTGSPARDGRAR